MPADPDGTLWFDNAGPSFSPDGTRLAFAEPDGVHIANVSNLSNCSSVTAPLVIPGATQPFWSAADEAANAGYVAPGGGGGGNTAAADRTPPTIAAVSVSPKRFAVGKASTALSARKKKHMPQGATVRYTLSEPARVTFTVERTVTGYKKGRTCVKSRKRKGRPCVLLVKQGTLTRSGVSGANQLAFSGRLGSRKLSPGSYELVVQAVDAAGNRSAGKTARFTIVRH